MALTDFQKIFRKALLQITDDIEFIYIEYLSSRTDEIRQEIIDGINNGTIKTKNDVRAITIKQAKGYQYLVDNDELPDFMKKENNNTK